MRFTSSGCMTLPTVPHERVEVRLASVLESILLVAAGPVDISLLCTTLAISRSDVDEALEILQQTLDGGIRLQVHVSEAQLVSAPENGDMVRRFLGSEKPAPLSRSALETLAVVAYRQPATRADIEAVRGVSSDRAVQTLLARNLIEERGHRQTPGRPLQYGTGFAFLEYFGLGSLADLPPLDLPEAGKTAPVGIGLRVTSTGNRENP